MSGNVVGAERRTNQVQLAYIEQRYMPVFLSASGSDSARQKKKKVVFFPRLGLFGAFRTEKKICFKQLKV